jgi:hypothetical protein
MPPLLAPLRNHSGIQGAALHLLPYLRDTTCPSIPQPLAPGSGLLLREKPRKEPVFSLRFALFALKIEFVFHSENG